jgi:hypothetical protein
MPIGDDDFMKAMQELDDISAQGYTPEPMEKPKAELWTKPLEMRQRRSLKGANTENRRNDRLLRATMGDEVFEDEMKGSYLDRTMTTMATATQPLFDLLSTANYTAAGALEEYMTTGNTFEAFKRGAAEFINAMPLLDEDDAMNLTGKTPTRATYSDVLKKADWKPFNDEDYNGAAIATTGFIMDVLLDPLTYVGGVGFAKTGGLGYTGGSRLLRKLSGRFNPSAGMVSGMNKVVEGAWDTGALQKSMEGGLESVTGKAFDVIRDLPGLKQAREFAGEKLMPEYEMWNKRRDLLSQARAASGNDRKELLEKAISFEETIRNFGKQANARNAGVLDMREAVLKMSNDLTPEQNVFLTYMMGNPEFNANFDSLAKQVYSDAPDIADTIITRKNLWAKANDQINKEGIEAGLWDANLARDNYILQASPHGERGVKVHEALKKSLNLPGHRNVHFQDDTLKSLNGMGASENARKYQTFAERVMSGLGTEFDPNILHYRRGIEHVRSLTSNNMFGSLLSDPNNKWVHRDVARAYEATGGERWSAEALETMMPKNASAKLKEDVVALRKQLDSGDYAVYKFGRENVYLPDTTLGELRRAEFANTAHPAFSQDKYRMNSNEPFRKGDIITLKDNKKRYVYDKVDEDGNVLMRELIKTKGSRKVSPKTKLGKERFILKDDAKFDMMSDAPAMVVPKEIANALHKADKFARNTDEEISKFLKFYDRALAPWKGFALLSPGFHTRNFMSAIFQDWQAGARNPGAQVDAWKILHRDEKVKLTVMSGGVEKPLEGSKQILDHLRKEGVLTEQFFAHEFAAEIEDELFDSFHFFGKKPKGNMQDFNDALTKAAADPDSPFAKNLYKELKVGRKGEREIPYKDFDNNDIKITHKELLDNIVSANASANDRSTTEKLRKVLRKTTGGDNPFLKLNRKFAQQIESQVRIAHWLSFADKDRAKSLWNAKGEWLSSENAALSVKKWHFDYGELSDTEKQIMKRVIPFYTWMRKNVPLQIEAIMRNPGRYANSTTKLMESIEDMSEDLEELPIPDYFQEQNMVRLPMWVANASMLANKGVDEVFGRDHKEGLMPLYLDPRLPFQDINSMNLKDIAASLTPFLRIPAESLAGKGGTSFFTERPIQQFEGELSETPLIPGTNIRLGEKEQYKLDALAPPVGKAQRIQKAYGEGNLLTSIMNEFATMKTVDTGRVARSKVYERREIIRNIKRRLRQQRGFENVPE